MGIRVPLIMSALIVVSMCGLSLWAWQLIPEGTRIAVHWDIANRPNGFASKEFALMVMPAAATGIALLFAVMFPLLGNRLDGSGTVTAYEVGWIGGLLVLAVCHVLIVLVARGYRPDIAGNAMFTVGLLLTVMGNFLGRTRPNPFVGVRTYWTLRSDYAWDKTNRLAGRIFVAVGLAILASLAVAGAPAAAVVLIVGVAGSVLVSVALSYVYWKRDPARRISQ
jgi:uncharacterized membrane protein